MFPLTCSATYQSRLFWCELSSFGDIGRRDFCLLSNIMGVNGARSAKEVFFMTLLLKIILVLCGFM